MKKQPILLTCMLTGIIVTTHAQMNATLPAGELNTTTAYTAKKPFSRSILRKFYEDYPSATNDAWATTENGYLVNFRVADIHYIVFLDQNGRMTSRIRFYREQHLPQTVRNQVKNYYGCYNIRSVKEVTSNNTTAYLVTIEDNMLWKVVRVVGPEMDIIEEHNKG